MALKALPRSKAKTAWGLMVDVKKAILADPKRADMRVYENPLAPQNGGPACGTVGCIAGWVAILGKGAQREGHNSEDIAIELLGEDINYRTVAKNAGDYSTYVFNTGEGDDCYTTRSNTPPTPAQSPSALISSCA